MSFHYFNYLPLAIGVFLVFSILIFLYERKYFSWVEKYWFFKRTRFNAFSSFIYFIAIGLLLTSTLDLRGKGEIVNVDIKDQKTVILIDTSASMLVEDVRPNRFKKSLVLARHFVKNSAGHQIAVVLFSDLQRKLIPFTDDVDLLDAKLAALEKANSGYGSSNISLAVQESIKYFEIDQKGKDKIVGNILLFTDSEEEKGIRLNLPDDVALAIVGIGTAKGGPIPMRSNDGIFNGYKEYNNERVISKLSEKHIKELGSYAKAFKYWIVGSYGIPTEEILQFFRNNYQTKLSEGTQRIRPVVGHKIAILGIVLFCLVVLLRLRGSLALGLLLIFIIFENGVIAEEKKREMTEEEIKLQEEILTKLEYLKKGELKENEKVSLAGDLLKANMSKESAILYDETIKNKDKISADNMMKWAVAHGKSGNTKKALNLLSGLQKRLEADNDKERLSELRNNVKEILKESQKNKQKNKQDKKSKKDQKNKQDQNDQQDQNSQQEQQNQQNQKGQKEEKNQRGQKEQKDQEGKNGQDDQKKQDEQNGQKDQEKKDDQKSQQDRKNKKENGEEKNNDDGQKDKNDKKSVKEREEEIKMNRKMKKIPAMLKQLMDGDRKIQEKYMNTSTEKNKNSEEKDW